MLAEFLIGTTVEWGMPVGHKLGSWDSEDCNLFIVDGKFAIDSDFWGGPVA